MKRANAKAGNPRARGRGGEPGLRAVIDAIPDAILVKDALGRCVAANRAAAGIMGAADPDELLGKTDRDLFPADLAEGYLAEDRSILRAEVPSVAREETRVVSGSRRSFLVTKTPLLDASGAIRGVVALARAVDGRSPREEALRKERDLLRTVVDLLPLAVHVKDTSFRKTMTNPADVQAVGAASETDVLGKTDFEVFPRPVAEAFFADDRAVMRSGEPIVDREESYVNRSGDTRWFLSSKTPFRDARGEIAGLVGVARDITEHRRSEAAIRESEETLRALLNATTDNAVMIAKDGTVQACNENFARAYGRPASEIVGTYLFDLMEGELKRSREERTRDVVASGKASRIEDTREGRAYDNNIHPILNASGEVSRVAIFSRDITEERRLQAQFLQAQKMESIGRLAGGIAHDFNNVLQVIAGYCELVEKSLAAGSPARAYATEIARAAKRATALTTQLLAFSRKQVLRPRVVSTVQLLGSIEAMLGRIIGEDIRLQTSLDPKTGNFRADPWQIEQVMLNLAINARDAMPNGGVLTIEASNRVFDETYALEHPGVKEGSYVRIAVSDTGSGMDRETLSHVFEPFFTTKDKGTGLGLSTAYGIVKQSEGHIGCYSEPGKGTTFTLYLPLTPEAPEAVSDAEAKAAPSLENETVLLVEDDEAVRAFIRNVLEGAGYRVAEASSGEEALSKVASERIKVSLLVTDVVIPGMSGKEVAGSLRAALPSASVLYVSGYTANVILSRGVLEEGVDFLQKPFSSQELLAAVRTILQRR